MYYPRLTEVPRQEQLTDCFLGYDHEDRIPEGAFYDTKNLTCEKYSLLAVRKKRGILERNFTPNGLLGRSRPAWVSGGELWYGFEKVTGVTLTEGDKTMVSMGAYILIFPDGFYFNTEKPSDRGYIDNTAVCTGVRVSLCTREGESILCTPGAAAPSEPAAGQYWLDTGASPHSLRVYSGETGQWTDVAAVYVMLEGAGITRGFAEGDGVTISGLQPPAYAQETLAEQAAALNGSHIIEKLRHSGTREGLILTGLLDESFTAAGPVTIARKAPRLDYVCEAGNRIWGCRYGLNEEGTETVNEICCCALGDFKNWHRYAGLSTDSYAASCGTDGPWTGAVNYLGYPCFFKEDRLHKVYISAGGAHQIVDCAVRGVQQGCGRSLAIVDSRLYYKSRDGICVYDGSLPALTGTALGDVRYGSAVGGSLGSRYYVSMQAEGGGWSLFAFDTHTGLWIREDDTAAKYMARSGEELYLMTRGGTLMALNGTAFTPESELDWLAETGLIGYASTGHKSVSRFHIRMRLPKGSRISMFIQYDSDGVWQPCGTLAGNGLSSFLLPVRPRRCDHFRLKLTGRGDALIYSFSKLWEEGSDG